MIEKRMAEIQARKLEIRSALQSDNALNLDEIQVELNALEKEEIEMRTKMEIANQINVGKIESTEIEKPEARKMEENKNIELEKRGAQLKENRSVTLAAGTVLLQEYQASDIRPTFNQVSTLLDRVTVKNFNGGESFKQPYVSDYGTGDYTGEGVGPSTTDVTFGYAEITKTKVGAYSEDSEEILKLPNANYDAEVVNGVQIALRKKTTKEILLGDGTSGHFVGIFSDKATAIDAATDLEISAIDDTTLDNIMFSFGGAEDVEDAAVLILNKSDLKAFVTLKDKQGRKFYEVKTNGNTGTINGVPYIINSACHAVSNTNTAAGAYAMAYGPLSNYTMAVFSPVDIQRSTDYKFKEGMIAHRGVVFAGGNVTSKNGFIRVKKATV